MLKARRQFGALDFYRFMSATGVVVAHFSLRAFDLDSGFVYAIRHFDQFVEFFFILSGFVIGLNYSRSVNSVRAIFTYLRRRIARIYPLHLLTLIVFLAPTILGVGRNPDKFTWPAVGEELLLVMSWRLDSPLPFNFPAWSISVEWFLYLLFPALIWLSNRVGLWSLVAVALIGFFGMNYLEAIGLAQPPLYNPLPGIPTFAIGVLISQTFDRLAIRRGALIGFAAFCIAVTLMVLHANYYLVLLLFSLCVLFTACGSSQPLFEGRACKTLGDASYAMYMLHALFLAVFVDRLWPKLSSGPVPLWYGVAMFALLVPTSIVTFKFFESPARRMISVGRPSAQDTTARNNPLNTPGRSSVARTRP